MTSKEFFDLVNADFARNRQALDRLSLLIFRVSQFSTAKSMPVRIAGKVLNLIWLRLIIGADIPGSVECGPGLRLVHAGRGVMLHPRTKLGAGVTLYHRVTMGVRDTSNQAPNAGDGVYIGTGAVVIGGITLGEKCRIGANAVVLRDVPAGATAVGIPATIKTPV